MDYISLSQGLQTFLQSDFLKSYTNARTIQTCSSRIEVFLSASKGSRVYDSFFGDPERTTILNANTLIKEAFRANQLAISQLETARKALPKEQKVAQETAQKAVSTAKVKIQKAVAAVEKATLTLEKVARKITHSPISAKETTASVKGKFYHPFGEAPPISKRDVKADEEGRRESEKSATRSKKASEKLLGKKEKGRKEAAASTEEVAKKAAKKAVKKKRGEKA